MSEELADMFDPKGPIRNQVATLEARIEELEKLIVILRESMGVLDRVYDEEVSRLRTEMDVMKSELLIAVRCGFHPSAIERLVAVLTSEEAEILIPTGGEAPHPAQTKWHKIHRTEEEK